MSFKVQHFLLNFLKFMNLQKKKSDSENSLLTTGDVAGHIFYSRTKLAFTSKAMTEPSAGSDLDWFW
jgi:hypothetical protein